MAIEYVEVARLSLSLLRVVEALISATMMNMIKLIRDLNFTMKVFLVFIA